MYQINKRPSLLMAILLATVLIATLGMIAALESQSGQSPPKHEVMGSHPVGPTAGLVRLADVTLHAACGS